MTESRMSSNPSSPSWRNTSSRFLLFILGRFTPICSGQFHCRLRLAIALQATADLVATELLGTFPSRASDPKVSPWYQKQI